MGGYRVRSWNAINRMSEGGLSIWYRARAYRSKTTRNYAVCFHGSLDMLGRGRIDTWVRAQDSRGPASMDKKHILDEIRRTAVANGGEPLGQNGFRTETGIKETDWRDKHWVR